MTGIIICSYFSVYSCKEGILNSIGDRINPIGVWIVFIKPVFEDNPFSVKEVIM